MFVEVKNSPKISSCLNLAVMNWDSTQAQNILVMLRLICSQTRTVPAPKPHKSLMRWQSRVVTKFWEIQVTEEKKKSHLTQQELTEETEITGAGSWVFPPHHDQNPPQTLKQKAHTQFFWYQVYLTLKAWKGFENLWLTSSFSGQGPLSISFPKAFWGARITTKQPYLCV